MRDEGQACIGEWTHADTLNMNPKRPSRDELQGRDFLSRQSWQSDAEGQELGVGHLGLGIGNSELGFGMRPDLDPLVNFNVHTKETACRICAIAQIRNYHREGEAESIGVAAFRFFDATRPVSFLPKWRPFISSNPDISFLHMAKRIQREPHACRYPLVTPKERLAIWEKARGLWKHRDPDPVGELKKIRQEWTRKSIRPD